jgi:hypothetical protein
MTRASAAAATPASSIAARRFEEKCSPVVVNKTNFGTLISITGEDDDELWAGHKIELRSQKVMGPGGKVVDSIRVHEAPKPKKPIKEELNDEVGF